MNFSDFALNKNFLRAIDDAGFTKPTPIQAKAIPIILSGRDLLGCARTGTGKTAAFVLPLLQRLNDSWTLAREIRVRSLILSPTRELALQLTKNIKLFSTYSDLTHTLVHGGVEFDEQISKIRAGVDILIATPGRMLDLISKKTLKLDQIELFIVDEADRMLDMGFSPDIRKIAKMLPQKRQALFFSATMPPQALRLANSFLRNPKRIFIDPISTPAENIEKSIYYVEKNNKFALLEWVLKQINYKRVLIFCRTRRGSDLLMQRMQKAHLPIAVLHGDKPQKKREQIVENFRSAKVPLLIATDLASRGIDIENISHIINFDLPNNAETFVHRIGRTARAGASGKALSFCDATEKNYLRNILTHLNESIEIVKDHPFHSEQVMNYSGRVQPKHSSKQTQNKKHQNKEKTWKLTPSERQKLHTKKEEKKKNLRRNPKKKNKI